MIMADGLGRDYGTHRAVDSISFQVDEGEILGLLGPNGAGKTTTVGMLTGLARPTRGRALVAGYDPVTQPREVYRRIGVVFETPNLYDRLTVKENLHLFARLAGASPGSVKKTVARLQLDEALGRRADRLSKGWRQRVLIARALLSDPKVLFLDEPTSGLDPNSAALLRKIIKEMRSEGRTILLTTHDMHEAEELCDRVGIVHQGRLAALDTPAALKDRGVKRLVVEYRVGTSILRKELPMNESATADLVNQVLRDGSCLSLQTEEYTLAAVFTALTGGELR